jgi:hypothetical protein
LASKLETDGLHTIRNKGRGREYGEVKKYLPPIVEGVIVPAIL